jgi:PAS domain S-box-containing protein
MDSNTAVDAMSDLDPLKTVEQARDRLAELRTRVDRHRPPEGARAVNVILGDIQGMLDKVVARYALLHDVLDRSNDIAFAKDRDGRYAMINPQGAVLFGKTSAEIVGLDDRALFSPEDAERIMAEDREVMHTGEARSREVRSTFHGVATTLHTTTTAWYGAEHEVRGVIGIAQEVAESRRHEDTAMEHSRRMRSMATELVLGEERLRRTLAAELHNGLGQDIALARMKLSMLRGTTAVELRGPLNGIEVLVEQADRSLRAITYQISPPTLHDLGLVAALQWLAEDLLEKHGLTVTIEDEDSPAVDDEETRVIVFRAVRELLLNVAQHAGVQSAKVGLFRQGDHVRITVEDGGAGFDTSSPDPTGFGLFGIQEQLKYVDGTIHVTSAPGRGTLVTLVAPATAAAAGTPG